MTHKQVTLVQGSGEWSALYVNGQLNCVGDHYVCEERIAQLFDIRVIHTDEFLQGGDKIDNCLDSLEDVEEAMEAAK